MKVHVHCYEQCVCLCAHLPECVFAAARMWFTACNNFMPEAPPHLWSLSSTTLYFLLLSLQDAPLARYSWQNQSASLAVFSLVVTMFPRVILKGTMIKKSQQKKRISPSNYKERFFVLDTQDLKYSERRPGVSFCEVMISLLSTVFFWDQEYVLAEEAYVERLHPTVQDKVCGDYVQQHSHTVQLQVPFSGKTHHFIL